MDAGNSLQTCRANQLGDHLIRPDREHESYSPHKCNLLEYIGHLTLCGIRSREGSRLNLLVSILRFIRLERSA
jgi:hypothetical protein